MVNSVAKRVRRGNKKTFTNYELYKALKTWAQAVSNQGGRFTRNYNPKTGRRNVYKKNGAPMNRNYMLLNLKEYLNARKAHLIMFPNNRKPFNVN